MAHLPTEPGLTALPRALGAVVVALALALAFPGHDRAPKVDSLSGPAAPCALSQGSVDEKGSPTSAFHRSGALPSGEALREAPAPHSQMGPRHSPSGPAICKDGMLVGRLAAWLDRVAGRRLDIGSPSLHILFCLWLV
jgi:hypothetical protein